MSFFDQLLFNVIILLFPIFIYLLYVAYSNSTNKKNNKFIFDFLCLTSIYLLMKYKIYFSNISFLLLVNVPLILSFFKKRYKCSFILSIIIVLYYTYMYDLPLVFNVIEYFVYFLFFLFFNKKNKDSEFFVFSFLFFKGVILSFEIFYILQKETVFIELVFQILLILLVFYVLLIMSITLLEKGEQILSLNKILKELEKEKVIRNSLFTMTHEIKNPIAVCKGYLDIMNYNDIEKVKKYNGIIKKEIDRTLIIMDEFLDYTKVKVNLENMDIVMLLEDTFLAVQSLLRINDIKLIKNIKDDEIYINGDYDKLKQVFVNIIKNSVEAMENKNGVLIVSLIEKNNKIIITIEDNGIGMDKETLENINKMFFTTKQKGTGLGIPLSEEIIKLHNGKIKYESVVNEKTKVSIILKK